METKYDAVGQQGFVCCENREKCGKNATDKQTHLIQVNSIYSWMISDSTEHNLPESLRHCHVADKNSSFVFAYAKILSMPHLLGNVNCNLSEVTDEHAKANIIA